MAAKPEDLRFLVKTAESLLKEMDSLRSKSEIPAWEKKEMRVQRQIERLRKKAAAEKAATKKAPVKKTSAKKTTSKTKPSASKTRSVGRGGRSGGAGLLGIPGSKSGPMKNR